MTCIGMWLVGLFLLVGYCWLYGVIEGVDIFDIGCMVDVCVYGGIGYVYV